MTIGKKPQIQKANVFLFLLIHVSIFNFLAILFWFYSFKMYSQTSWHNICNFCLIINKIQWLSITNLQRMPQYFRILKLLHAVVAYPAEQMIAHTSLTSACPIEPPQRQLCIELVHVNLKTTSNDGLQQQNVILCPWTTVTNKYK